MSTAILDGDPAGTANCYTEHLDRYYIQRDWNRTSIRDHWTQWLTKDSERITSLSIKYLHVDRANGTFTRAPLVKDPRITTAAG